MRDRGAFWAPARDWQHEEFEGDDQSVSFGMARLCNVVSGDIGAFLSRRGTVPLGPRDIAASGTYALRLSRDRVLYVSQIDKPIDQGWSDAGYAVAEMTDGMILCDVSGARGLQLLQQGTSYDLTATDVRANESCNILFGGLRVAIVRRADGWRLHVERPYATAMWSWFHDALMRVEA